ncbi:MAG: imidazole glycerol phosphate synthase subunit HisH [Akkermansia sp.]
MKLGIIDYGAGNLRSVANSFLSLGVKGHLVHSSEDMEGVTHLVLPGVGAFGDCSQKLVSQGLDDVLKTWIAADRPFLGICVGYQVLFEHGEETPDVPGLGVFKGSVVHFPEMGIKVPHMGWNNLEIKDATNPIWDGIGESPYFYFVHSYYPRPEDESLIGACCTYGEQFAAAICRGRLIATQFHPEKSQKTGIHLLSNFLKF